jgi:hypothetical protein
VSPRAVDKRARPGNEATPAPIGPPTTLSTADFGPIEQVAVEANGTEVTEGATD